MRLLLLNSQPQSQFNFNNNQNSVIKVYQNRTNRIKIKIFQITNLLQKSSLPINLTHI